MRLIKVLAFFLLLILLTTACTWQPPVLHTPTADPDALLANYIKAFKDRDIEAMQKQIVSANYSHRLRDGSIENQEAYLTKLNQIFQLSVVEVTILDKQATTFEGGCTIDLFWKVKLAFGLFNITTLDVIDKTTFTYKLEGTGWRLIEDAPMLKDGEVLYWGMTNKELDFSSFNTFSMADKNVYVWAGYQFAPEFVNLTHNLGIKWYDPTGKLYFDNVNLFTPTATDWAQWSPLPVKGKVPATLKGKWHVDVYLDDVYKFTQEFTLTD